MPDELFHILAPAATILGVVVLTLALFQDALRQHVYPRHQLRRCPKCWYDLSHTKGLCCSECGHTAKFEKKLHQARRSKRGIWIALILFSTAYTGIAIPRVMKRGWPGWIPTTALALLVPQFALDERSLGSYLANVPLMTNQRRSQWAAGKGLPEKFTMEWAERIQAGRVDSMSWFVFLKLTTRQARNHAYIEGQHASASSQWKPEMFTLAESIGELRNRNLLREIMTLPSFRIRTRERWPVGVPLYATVDPTEYFNGENVEATLINKSSAPTNEIIVGQVGPPGCYTRPEKSWWFEQPSTQRLGVIHELMPVVSFRVEGRRRVRKRDRVPLAGAKKLTWQDEFALPVEIVESINDVLQGVEVPAVATLLSATTNTSLHESPGETGEPLPHLHFDLSGFRAGPLVLDDLTIALRLEVFRDGVLIYGGSAWWDGTAFSSRQSRGLVYDQSHSRLIELRQAQLGISAESAPRDTGHWQLRITGDAELALRNFDCDRYWQGSVTIPITWREPDAN